MFKFDIVNGLGSTRELPRYLEICTPTTGVRFGKVDAAVFPVRHRIMYRCAGLFDDGQETLRTVLAGSHEMVRALHALTPPDQRYDVVFVDPYHDYAASITDLHGALCLLKPGGVMVVHDCNPVDPDTVSPEYRDGAWCGVTYQAFIDFVLGADIAGFCTVDCDYGCGVVLGRGAVLPDGLPLGRPSDQTAFEWSVARLSDDNRYAFFDRHRATLLNLVSPSDFADACGLPPPEPEPASDVPDLSKPAPAPDAALRVVAGGEDLPLAAYSAGWHEYAVPPGTRTVVLASKTFSPAEDAAPSADTRRLGLAVAGLRLGERSINLADPCLCEGWHPEERAAGFPWRWTDGNATLKLPRGTKVLGVFTTCRAGP